MIARIWHGMTRARDYDAYWAFLHRRAIPDYRQTTGNRGVRLFRRRDGDRAHFLTLSYWARSTPSTPLPETTSTVPSTIPRTGSTCWSSSRRCNITR